MGFTANRFAVADMRIRQKESFPPRWRSRSISQISPQPVSVASEDNSQTAYWRGFLVAGFWHGEEKIFARYIVECARPFFRLTGYVRNHACCSCAHQSPRCRMSSRVATGLIIKNGDLVVVGVGIALINESQLGEKLHRVFTGATGHALNAFLNATDSRVIAISVWNPLSCTSG